MKECSILGENRFNVWTRERVAWRGVVIREGQLLLTYEVNTDQWFLPGGGLEEGESLETCVMRELAEETGYAVMPQERVLTIHEYYEQWRFVSHYFLCEAVGTVQRRLTEREAQVGLEPCWLPFEEAMAIFAKHADYADPDEMKRGAYLREFTALCQVRA